MKTQDTQVLIIVGFLALIGACAEAPAAAVDAARARVDAVSAEGQIYAPEEYANARDAVGRLDTELQAQADRFALTRSYDRVTEITAEVERAADDVERAIETERDRLRTETTRFLADAAGALDEAPPR